MRLTVVRPQPLGHLFLVHMVGFVQLVEDQPAALFLHSGDIGIAVAGKLLWVNPYLQSGGARQQSMRWQHAAGALNRNGYKCQIIAHGNREGAFLKASQAGFTPEGALRKKRE